MSNQHPDFVLPKDFCANPREAYTIPAYFYTQQAAFEHEKERVFTNSWICMAHGSEVAQPNDYITREIIGENIVIVRGRDSVLRAFYNVCPHRGTNYSVGKVKQRMSLLAPIMPGPSSSTVNWHMPVTARMSLILIKIGRRFSRCA